MSAGQESDSPIRENRSLLPAPLPPDEARGTLAAAAGVSTVGLRPPFDTPAAAFSSRLSRHSHLDCRARGSGHSVQTYRKTHPDVLETLRLFDAATAAGRIEIPMLLAVARFDPAVAPPCQFSVANALPTSNPHETVILDAGHFDYPGSGEQHALLTEKVGRFFGATSCFRI